MHPLIDLARAAIRAHLASRPRPAGATDADSPLPWGVFVSLHEQGAGDTEGPLRGCIGSLDLKSGSLEAEVARVAISSATADPRFPPLRLDEVEDLAITVYLLDAPEPIGGPEDLDPARYGIIVSGSGGRRGLLLPAISGIDTAEQQYRLALRKAGLPAEADVALERFTARILR